MMTERPKSIIKTRLHRRAKENFSYTEVKIKGAKNETKQTNFQVHL
jgi:hypothetical protein